MEGHNCVTPPLKGKVLESITEQIIFDLYSVDISLIVKRNVGMVLCFTKNIYISMNIYLLHK